MPLEVKIDDILESSRLNPRGELTRTRRVVFRVGPYGPFTRDIPEEEFTAQKVQEVLEKERQAIEQATERYRGE